MQVSISIQSPFHHQLSNNAIIVVMNFSVKQFFKLLEKKWCDFTILFELEYYVMVIMNNSIYKANMCVGLTMTCQ